MTRVAQHTAAPSAPREQPRWALWLCGACLILAIIVVTSIISPTIRQQWKLSLFRQNEPYTELAFSHPTLLPGSAVRGASIHISFSITNNGAIPVSYRYVVASGSGTASQSLESARRKVAPGATWTVNTVVVPKCAEPACRMEVSLPQQHERIDFLFKLKQPAS